MTENGFPLDSFKDAAPHLRRPFAPNAVRWKLQTASIIVPYVDARTVIARLNLVVPHLWSTQYEPWGERVDTNLLICHLTIDGLTRSDVGKGAKGEPQKGAYSDSLKRAAVHFGVGHSLYAMKRIYLNDIPAKARGKDPKVLSAEAEEWLRRKYDAWLATNRGQHFGEELDHGDAPDPVGDEAEVQAAPQEDLELAAKRQSVEALYDEKIVQGNGQKSKLPKGRFQAQLRSADSVEKLDELAERIKAIESEAA